MDIRQTPLKKDKQYTMAEQMSTNACMKHEQNHQENKQSVLVHLGRGVALAFCAEASDACRLYFSSFRNFKLHSFWMQF